MLLELIIRNFAIIDRLQLSVGPGFSVLTGETGAGKSIIIDAVGLLLGDRGRPELIRTGEDEATVEALFDISAHPEIRRLLAEAGCEDSDELLVKRVISRTGKNRAYANGSLTTVGQLEALISRLIAIYGQHEHQQLQRSEAHLELLDRFAGLEGEVSAYRHCHQETVELAARLEQLTLAEHERQQKVDLLSYQSRELSAASLCEGEDEELAGERLLLQNAERLAAAVEGGYETLYGADGALCEQLGTLISELTGLSSVESRFQPLAEALGSALYIMEDAARELRDYGGQIAMNPGRQEEVEERLALIAAFKRKYAPSIPEILRRQGEIDRELQELADIGSVREKLQETLEVARERLQQAGAALSSRRREAAGRLREAVEGELKDLAMEKSLFEIRFFPLDQPGSHGLERGEFYLAPNPGEETRPLAWIASGGELSRIMLALKRAAPEAERIPTLVFDEVDAGIGGAAATSVGEKLRGVAGGKQVICVTHLPQVAAFADHHYQVEKQEQEGRTVTSVGRLLGENRVKEMARMLGGARITDRTLEHAREIIAQPGR